MVRSILVGTLLALFLTSPLLCQILPELGARVRITTGTERLTGTLSAVNADELTITSRSGERVVATSEVTRIEVRKGNYAGRGAVYGFWGGAISGATLAALDNDGSTVSFEIGVLSGVLGAGIGAFTGLIVHRWDEPGARVRITTGTERLTGTLIVINADELTIASRSGERRVASSEVTSIEVRRGNYAGKGALYGFGGGAALGAILGYAAGEDCSGSSGSRVAAAPVGLAKSQTDDTCFAKGFVATVGGVLFGILGAGTGALVGLFVDRWSETPLERLSMGLGVPAGGGYAASVSVSF